MIKTFTPNLDITEKNKKKAKLSDVIQNSEPSAQTLQNILNFSKNLEIKQSKLIEDIEYLRS